MIARWRLVRWPVAALGVVIAVLLSGPMVAGAIGPDLSHLHPVRSVAGTVTIVNAAGDAFCMDLDVSGDQLCSVPYQPPGSARLQVGQHVSGTVLIRPVGDGTAEEIFVMSEASPPPEP